MARTKPNAAPFRQQATTADIQPLTDKQYATIAVVRYLGHQAAVARGLVDELSATDIVQVLEAAKNAFSARADIENILTQAQDRRRDAAASEAQREMVDRRRSALAQRTIERVSVMSSEEAAAAAAKLTPEEAEALAAIADDADPVAKANEILQAAEERLQAASVASTAKASASADGSLS
jgi:hypothetical protein